MDGVVVVAIAKTTVAVLLLLMVFSAAQELICTVACASTSYASVPIVRTVCTYIPASVGLVENTVRTHTTYEYDTVSNWLAAAQVCIVSRVTCH